MKKLLLILLFAFNAQAATWQQFAKTSESALEFAPDLVTKHDNKGKVLVVWMRETRKNSIAMTKYELHCGSKSYRTLQKGIQTTGQEYSAETKTDSWHWAFPDSAEMALIDYTCYYFK